ncbi:MAG: SsrA-binding protein SmpB [Helcococcus sp.]|nr:SsrA-binding protein SmpB [Helcococcus sp.]
MSKTLAKNRRAKHDYFLEEYFEAGIVLEGNEVKSIKQTRVSIKESFCQVRNNEVFIVGMHVTPYEYGNNFSKLDPTRTRKLLLNKVEIRKINQKINEKGYALIPLEVKEVRGLIKVDIGLAKGKKLYDKRQDLKEKDDKRNIERVLKERYY